MSRRLESGQLPARLPASQGAARPQASATRRGRSTAKTDQLHRSQSFHAAELDPRREVHSSSIVEFDFASMPIFSDAESAQAPDTDTPPSPAELHRLAAEGLTGSPKAMPHLTPIQRSFGRYGAHLHDVKARIGGPAAVAGRAMRAAAFARGQQIAFRRDPDLHTAAHEAAHIIQQRGSLQLAGGIGAPGDRYERHADAVADAVVSGQSAEPLLAELRGAARVDGPPNFVPAPTVQLLADEQAEEAFDPGPQRSIRYTNIPAHIDPQQQRRELAGLQRGVRPFVFKLNDFAAVPFQSTVQSIIEEAFRPITFFRLDFSGRSTNKEDSLDFDSTTIINEYEGITGVVFLNTLRNERFNKEKDKPDSGELTYFDTAESLGRAIANAAVHEMGHLFNLDHTSDRTNFMWTPPADPLYSKPNKTYEEKKLLARTINTSVLRFTEGQLIAIVRRIVEKRAQQRPGVIEFF